MHYVIKPHKTHFGPLPKKPKYKSFPKKITAVYFKPLHYSNFKQKIRKIHVLILLKLGKFHLGSISGPLWPKLQNKIFPKKSLQSVLSFHATVSKCKKSEKFSVIFNKTWKTLFWSHFPHPLAQTPQTRYFSKKIITQFMLLNYNNFM